MINILNPDIHIITVEFSPKIWEKLLAFWQKYSSRLEKLSGIQRHLMIPMFGMPCLEVHQWDAVRLALLQAAKGMPEDRDWLNEAVLEIEKTLRPEAFK